METVSPIKIKILKPIDFITSFFFHEKCINKLPIQFNKVNKILVFDPTALGDMVMILPYLKILRKNFSKAEITFLGGNWAKEIIGKTNCVDKYIEFSGYKVLLDPVTAIKNRKEIKEVVTKVNNEKYDIILEARGDFRYIYFMHFLNGTRKISYLYSGGKKLLTDYIKMPKNYLETHLVEDKIYFCQQLGCKVEESDKYPTLEKVDDYMQKREKFISENNLKGYKLVGIHPGAGTKIRQYPDFDILLEGINKIKKCAFLIFEGPNEEEAVNKIIEKAKAIKAKYVHIKQKLHDYITTISFCDIIICNDSSAGHIANAYQIPTIVIYGPVEPDCIKPYNKKVPLECISVKLDCKPCYKTNCPFKEQYCFTKIESDTVIKKIAKYLK